MNNANTIDTPMNFSLTRKRKATMLQLTEIHITPPHRLKDMFEILKGMISQFWVLPTTTALSVLNLFFGDNLLLNITNMQECAQLAATGVSVILAILGGKYTWRTIRSTSIEKQASAQAARDKNYRENIQFLKQEGFINAGTSDEDRKRIYELHFGPIKED